MNHNGFIFLIAITIINFTSCSVQLETPLESEPRHKCDLSNACGSGFYCLDGKCVAPDIAQNYKDDITCTKDSECPSTTQICQNNKCFTPTDSEVTDSGVPDTNPKDTGTTDGDVPETDTQDTAEGEGETDAGEVIPCEPACKEGEVCNQGECCTPDCTGKLCGDNGCGGFCGDCATPPESHCKNETTLERYNSVGDCGADFTCTYQPITVECGFGCDNGACKPPDTCTPDCVGKECGDDGCKGVCGLCETPPPKFCQDETDLAIPSGPGTCNSSNHCEYPSTFTKCPFGCEGNNCIGCTPDCINKDCGDDGCGGTCGSCYNPPESYCITSSTLRIYFDNGQCNSDKCEYQYMDTQCTNGCKDGKCANCVPDCTGKTCGPDGCGEVCGSCATSETCTVNGTCECKGVKCNNTCCNVDEICYSNACCKPNCNNKECSDDGCGGSCGTCALNAACSAGKCICPYTSCNGNCCIQGQVCYSNACCTPSCTNKECGSNGCGGSCGTCGQNQTCDANGKCQDPPPCPNNGFRYAGNNHCYWWLTDDNWLGGATWSDAKSSCEKNGAYLVTFTSQQEESAVVAAFNGSSQCWWFGCSDAGKEGTFTWVTGEQLSYTHWCNGQPNDANGGQDYCMWAGCSSNLGPCWNDDNSYNRYKAYICEANQ